MKILVANLGSTSFKYRLFDMDDRAAARPRRDRTDRLAREPLRRSRSAITKQELIAARPPTTPRPCSIAWRN